MINSLPFFRSASLTGKATSLLGITASLLGLTASLLGFSLLLSAQAEEKEEIEAAAKVGEAAPEFTLTDSTGTSHNLSDFKGKIVVLEWVNFDCPFVKKHYRSNNLPTIQANYTEGDDAVIWLAINSSAEGKQGHLKGEDFTKRASEEGFEGTALLEDHDGKVGKLYGARTTPHMFVIDAEGTLAYAGAIDSVASSNQEDIEKSENYVTIAIEALRKGEEIKMNDLDPYGCSVKY